MAELSMREAYGQALAEYGAGIGVAFQITDDFLDASSGKDRQDETTCLSVYPPDAARRRAESLIEGAVSAVRGLRNAGPVEPLVAIAGFVLTRIQ